MKSDLRKKTACILSVFSLGMNSKAEKIEKSLSSQSDKNFQTEEAKKLIEGKNIAPIVKDLAEPEPMVEYGGPDFFDKVFKTGKEKKLEEEISKNMEKKNNYKKDISKLKIDTYIPNVPQKEKKQSMKSMLVNLLVGLGVIVGVGWGVESLVSMLWQRIARGVHVKNSAEHKEILKYLSELDKFTPSHVMADGITTRQSQDGKAKMYFINNYDKAAELKIENEIKKDNENVVENIIIFGKGDKDITIESLGSNIKKLCVVSSGCVKICKAAQVEFFYAKCSNLVIDKQDIVSTDVDSKLKEAILNIRNISIEEDKKNFSVIAYEELVELIKNNGLLGGKKPDNIEYKTMKGLISSNGFGEKNWFTVYSKEITSGNK